MKKLCPNCGEARTVHSTFNYKVGKTTHWCRDCRIQWDPSSPQNLLEGEFFTKEERAAFNKRKAEKERRRRREED